MGNLSDIGLKFISKLSGELNSGKLDLPAFPDIAHRVKKALESEDVSAEQVAKIVSSEPILTARLLKVANSAMMNPSGVQISDIRTAITRLGFEMVHTTAVSIALQQLALSESIKHLRDDMAAVWKRSVNVAAMCYVISKKQTGINPDEGMMVGLLHSIGKIYILTRIEQHFPEIAETEPEVLNEILDQWHTGVGCSILQAWNFSEEISTAVDEYTDLDRTHYGPPDIGDVLQVASLFTEENPPSVDMYEISAFSRLRIMPDSANEFIEESSEEVKSLMQALGS